MSESTLFQSVLTLLQNLQDFYLTELNGTEILPYPIMSTYLYKVWSKSSRPNNLWFNKLRQNPNQAIM